MDEHTAAILFGSLAAVLIVGYTVYRAVKSHQLRKRLEDEAWQKHIGKPIPWENKTRSRHSAIELGNQMHRQAEQELRYRQQVGRTKRTKVENHPTTSLFPPSSFELPDTSFAREPDLGPSPFDSHKSSFEGGGGSFGGGGASDSWGSSDSCSSDSGGGSDGGGGGDCGGSSD